MLVVAAMGSNALSLAALVPLSLLMQWQLEAGMLFWRGRRLHLQGSMHQRRNLQMDR